MTLSDDEIETLKSHKKITNQHEVGVSLDPDDGSDLQRPWRLNDGRSGVTLEMCNAVRCAVDDGLAYREVAELFSFLSDRTHAHAHATGECRHEGGVEPTETGGNPGPPAGRVAKTTCTQLRRMWRLGTFDTYADAASWADTSRSTAWKHISGECRHG